MCIHISVMYMHVYLCVCACVSHSLSCEYSCLSAAFFQQEEGRKQQIRGIQESWSDVAGKDLYTQLKYPLSKNVASKDVGSNLF